MISTYFHIHEKGTNVLGNEANWRQLIDRFILNNPSELDLHCIFDS